MIGDANIQAMRAISTAQAVSANNVANMNTQGFKASSAVLESGPGGRGVRVGAIEQSTASGGLVQVNTPTNVNGRMAAVPTYQQASNTDLVREMVNMNTNQRAFEANANAYRVSSDMVGTLLDMVV